MEDYPFSNLKMPKDIENMIKELLLQKKMGVDSLIDEVTNEISNANKKGHKRFIKLKNAINEKYPNDASIRGAVDGLTYTIFKNAFELYYIGNNSALFIELQGLLERFAVDKMCEFIAVNKDALIILKDAFSKKTLIEVAEYFKKINLWNDDDITFAKNISQIRNGIAHKNAKLVSKKLGNGREESMSSIKDNTDRADIIPFIIHTIDMTIKISEVMRPNVLKNPRFIAKYDAYKKLIGPILNLHGELLLENYNSTLSAVILNRMYSRAILLSSEELGDNLLTFKHEIIEFHELLHKNDKDQISNKHQKVSGLASIILDGMKKEISNNHCELDINEIGRAHV